jgi:splicing factor 3B subunit 2
METPSGFTSVTSTIAGGLETPDFLELRKTQVKEVEEDDGRPRSLYQVLDERQTSVRGMMGSDRAYDVSNVVTGIPVLGEDGRPLGEGMGAGKKRKAPSGQGVDVSIDADALEGMSEEELRRRYDKERKGNAGVPGGHGEDMSDIIAKETAARAKRQKLEKDRKKEKEYKF